MKMIQKFEFHAESREERLPNFDSDFPDCREVDILGLTNYQRLQRKRITKNK
ncbi:hypothetical protein [Sporofaciens musculi]|uniref:hypothetical protein n=1 Tax=Sporofaciens musculi TaxID=2681861 RepID=UPI002F3EABE6